MDIEQVIRDMNSIIGVDADQVGVEGRMMELRLTVSRSRSLAVLIARPHP
jgi:hypothetical protein